MTKRNTKSYSDLILLPTFEERFRYLKLDGIVGEDTFGFRRWLNQTLYRSKEWRSFRDRVIARDNGCDLGVEGFEIYGTALIHHINPITYDDVINRSSCLFDMNNAITTVLDTHNAIHYGDEKFLSRNKVVSRTPNDTCPWRK